MPDGAASPGVTLTATTMPSTGVDERRPLDHELRVGDRLLGLRDGHLVGGDRGRVRRARLGAVGELRRLEAQDGGRGLVRRLRVRLARLQLQAREVLRRLLDRRRGGVDRGLGGGRLVLVLALGGGPGQLGLGKLGRELVLLRR